MFTFTAAQLAGLGRSSLTRRLGELIRTHYPTHSSDVSPAEMDAVIGRQLGLAQRYGLDDERSASVFVLTAFLLGEGFDERVPALAQVLASDELTASAKAQAMEDFSRAVFGALEFGGQP